MVADLAHEQTEGERGEEEDQGDGVEVAGARRPGGEAESFQIAIGDFQFQGGEGGGDGGTASGSVAEELGDEIGGALGDVERPSGGKGEIGKGGESDGGKADAAAVEVEG